jgi:glycosyltransferase involved in cell wall biosynthesis
VGGPFFVPAIPMDSLTSVDIDLCVVVPAHNEQGNLPILYRELSEHLGSAGIRFELLIVDDGSTDDTAAVMRGLSTQYHNVRGLRLSRNFGHQAAVSTGLLEARANAVAVMDADLQDRPADLVPLYRAWQAGADVAYAVRRSRKEHIALRAAYLAFYRLQSRLANIPVHVDSGDFCVMDARFVGRLNELPERLRFVRGLRAWLGGRQVAVPVDLDARRTGRPQYTLRQLVRLAIEGFVSFSDAPLRIASVFGFVVSGIAFAGMLVVLWWKLSGRLPIGMGVATTTLSVLFLGGVQLIAIGILGEYVGRIFQEIKARPVAIVDEIIDGAVASDARSARRLSTARPAHALEIEVPFRNEAPEVRAQSGIA